MKRLVLIEETLVTGDTMRKIIKVFPTLETNFKQRKNYDEYYYESSVVDFSLEDIERLIENGCQHSIISEQSLSLVF